MQLRLTSTHATRLSGDDLMQDGRGGGPHHVPCNAAFSYLSQVNAGGKCHDTTIQTSLQFCFHATPSTRALGTELYGDMARPRTALKIELQQEWILSHQPIRPKCANWQDPTSDTTLVPVPETDSLGRDYTSLQVRIYWLALSLSSLAGPRRPASQRVRPQTPCENAFLPPENYLHRSPVGSCRLTYFCCLVRPASLRPASLPNVTRMDGSTFQTFRLHAILMWPDAGGPKNTGPPEGSGDNRHCIWPKTDAMLVLDELSPAIYIALYFLRQDNSALLNMSNECPGVGNPV